MKIKIKIKKIADERTYYKVQHTTKIEVNGKPVKIYSYQIDDPQFSVFEGDTEFDEKGYNTLTDAEKETVQEHMDNLHDWKDGEELEEEIDWD